MSSKAPKTVEAYPEDWLVQLMGRENLSKGIKADNVPYITLQNHARICYGSRGRPVTPLEQAEHDLHEKLKAKVPILQLQRQLKFVEQLEEEQKNYEEAQRSKNATREDLLSDSEDDAPPSKRRKLARKVVAEDHDMAPPAEQAHHISRANDEPSKPQALSQKAAADAEADAELARNLQAARNAESDQDENDAEIAPIQAEELSLLADTSSDAIVVRHPQLEESRAHPNQPTANGPYSRGLHGHHTKDSAQWLTVRRLDVPENPPRLTVQRLDSDPGGRQTTATIRRKARSKASGRGSARVPDGEDEIDYESGDRDAGLLARRTQNNLARQIELDKAKHGLGLSARAISVAGSVRPRAKRGARQIAIHNQRAPRQSLILHGARAGRESNQSDADDDDDKLSERPAARPLRERPGSRLKKAPAGSATLSGFRAGAAGAHGMPPPSLPGAVLTQENRDPHESNTMTMCRIQIGLHAAQNAANGNPPLLPPSRAPHGRPSQDHDDENVQPDTEPAATLYEWVGGKRYRLVRPLNKRGDREEDREVLCLSDEPSGCKSPPPRWQKFKLQGLKNGRVWSEDWKSQPDHQPKGAQYYMVPAREAMNRPRLPDLELSRKHGMERGEGSEYVGGPGSLAGSQAGIGMGCGSVIGGSVVGSMALPSTNGRVSKVFSVRKGYSVMNHDPTQKHERSVMRTRPVSSIADDSDAPQRTLAQRLGLDVVETASAQGSPINTASTSSAPRNTGQASRRQLTLTNVAILEAQTCQPTHPTAVVRGKLRDVAPGDEGRTIWFGDETPRRPASIAPSGSLRGAPQTASQTRAAASGSASARNGGAGHLPPIAPGSTVPRGPRDIDIDISETDLFISPAPQNVNHNRTAASVTSSARNGSAPRLPPIAPGSTISRDPRDIDIAMSEDDRLISTHQTQREQELEAQFEASKRREPDMKAELEKLSGINATGMESADDRYIHGGRRCIPGQGSRASHTQGRAAAPGGQRLDGVPRDPRDVTNYGIPNTMKTGMGSSNAGSAYGGSRRGSRGGRNFRGGNCGGPGGRGGFGGHGGLSQAGGSSFSRSQRGGRRGGGESQYRESQCGGGRGRGRVQRQETQAEELERFRKEAEEKYPFQEA